MSQTRHCQWSSCPCRQRRIAARTLQAQTHTMGLVTRGGRLAAAGLMSCRRADELQQGSLLLLVVPVTGCMCTVMTNFTQC
jgi:hypothetical protein